MESNDRDRVHEEWQIGSCQVVVATIAFGMGKLSCYSLNALVLCASATIYFSGPI